MFVRGRKKIFWINFVKMRFLMARKHSFAENLPFVANFVENICKFVLEVFRKDNNFLEEYLPITRFPGLQPPGDP